MIMSDRLYCKTQILNICVQKYIVDVDTDRIAWTRDVRDNKRAAVRGMR